MALGAGSIAFTGFNADGTDNLAFVALDAIPAGTTIFFRDDEWGGSSFFDANEGRIQWTATSAVAAGTVVQIDNSTSGTLIATNTGTVARIGSPDFSGTDEIVYAYIDGNAGTPNSLTTNPIFLTAVANNTFASGGPTTGPAAGGIPTLSGTGLVAGTTALAFGNNIDIAAYNGSRGNQASFAAYLPALNNAVNFITQDGSGNQAADGTAPDAPFATTAFTLQSGPTESQTVVFSSPLTVNNNEGNSGSTAFTFTVSRIGGTTGDVTFSGQVSSASANAADFTGQAAVPFAFNGTIPAGSASVAVTVQVAGDTAIEPNESFTLTLQSVGNSDGTVPTTLGAQATATGTIVDDDTPPSTTLIGAIQGTGHLSPLVGQVVTTAGTVIAVDTNGSRGFYIQDGGDGNSATSDGIFVFLPSGTLPTVGHKVQVTGTVLEFTPSGAAPGAFSTTELASVSSIVDQGVAPAVAPTVIGGPGGLLPPTQDLVAGGLFYESLEGMLVKVVAPKAVSPTNGFTEIFTIVDNDANPANGYNATGLNARGNLQVTLGSSTFGDTNTTGGDFNPERIQIDDDSGILPGFTSPAVNVGATLGDVTGIVRYDFGNYEVIATQAYAVTQASTLVKETTALVGAADKLTIAAYNAENLDPGDGAARFTTIGNEIVNALKSPDIIALQEIQDNDGATNSSVTSASVTLQNLVNAIATAGGPTYIFIDNPFIGDDTNGGEPGGNIRTAYLYNADRVGFVAGSLKTVAPDGSPLTAPSVDQQTNIDNPFFASRPPLIATFTFNGENVTVVNNHFTSKGGSAPLLGSDQPPLNGGEVQRSGQAQAVNNFVDSLLAVDPNAKIVVAGDLNEFPGEEPMQVLQGLASITNYDVPGTNTTAATATFIAGGTKVLNDLGDTLPANEQFDYVFDGNSETLDHVLVSNSLLAGAQFDIVRINADFADQTSDHEPLIASLTIAVPNVAPVITSAAAVSVAENTTTVTTVTATDANGDTLTYSITGGADQAKFAINQTTGALSFVAAPDFEKPADAGSNNVYDVTVAAADGKGGTSTQDLAVTVTNVNDTFDLQILHFYGEAGTLAAQTAPILGALVDKFKGEQANTLTLAEGDTWIPGPWLVGGADPSLNAVPGIGSTALARPDVAIMNALGVNASALGNHEFDLGSPVVSGAIAASGAWVGAQFPFITSNLDFAADSSLRPLADASLGGNAANAFAGKETSTIKGKIAPYAVTTVNGEKIGIVGATTFDLLTKTSPNGTTVKDDGNPATDDLQEVAAYIQASIDALRATGVNKIVMVDQLDDLDRNKALAPLLSGVDIMVAGGGHERQGDANDVAVGFNGHGADFQENYPIVTAGSDGVTTLIVTTDTEYTYLGRLVVQFDAAGVINTSALNTSINGAYAASAATLEQVYNNGQTAAQIVAGSVTGSKVQAISNAIDAVVTAKDGNKFGYSDVYLEGDRVFGRTQEVNLGDLTADANAFKARTALGLGEGSVMVSLKNGGGLRASIGSIDEDGGKIANPLTPGAAGNVSQLDVENALRFDNKLMVFDTTPQGLLNILNFAAGLSNGPGQQSGGYAQVGGLRFSYDSASPVGQKVKSIALIDDQNQVISKVYENGALVASAPATISVVILNFTANGGDGYPIKANGDNFRYLLANGTVSAAVSEALDFTAPAGFSSVGQTAATILGEQKALEDFMEAKHGTPETAYDVADTPASLDTRIQILSQRADGVFDSATPDIAGDHAVTVAEGATVIIKTADLTENDPDNSGTQLTYTVTGTSNGTVKVNGVAATTFTQADIAADKVSFTHDGSETTAASFTVTLKDPSGNVSAPTVVAVSVTPVNDAPVITSSAALSVAENTLPEIEFSSSNIPSFATVTATDAENDTLTYSITGGADADHFGIDAATGALTFFSAADFETPESAAGTNVYDISVSVSDGHGGVAVQSIAVTVTDVAEPGQTVVGDTGIDFLVGTTGGDQIYGLGSDDTVYADDGNDVVITEAGSDFISAGRGADFVIAGDGFDTVYGGAGDDVLLAGGDDDTVFADAGNDTVDGGAGNDVISGGDGNDQLFGGDGNDDIAGGAGDDAIFGGDGDNLIDAGEGLAFVVSGSGNDTITTGSGNDTIVSGGGDDLVAAGSGNNVIDAGAGNDTITAGNGVDVVFGGEGDDVIDAGGGNDILTGGPGNDTFVFGSDIGVVVITDFGTGDILEFQDGLFANAAAVQSAAFQYGSDVAIVVDDSIGVFLKNVALANLTADSFHVS